MIRTVGYRIFLLPLLLIVLSSCITVDTNEVAVAKNSMTGKVHDEVYNQGMYHVFLRSWVRYDLREIQYPSGGQSDVLDVLTSDQLRIDVDAAFRYRIDPTQARELYLEVGNARAVQALVYNTFRSAVRDGVASVSAVDLLSENRAGMAEEIGELMKRTLEPRGVFVTEFFLRGIDPPSAIRQAVEEKLAREQQVERETYQTQVIAEQAEQRRVEAAGIRDAQQIIAASLVGEAGRAYLAYEGLQALKEAARGENNLIISPSEGGLPLMRPIP